MLKQTEKEKALLWEQCGNMMAQQSHPKSSKKLLMQYEAKLMRFWNWGESENFKEQDTLTTGWRLICSHGADLFEKPKPSH